MSEPIEPRPQQAPQPTPQESRADIMRNLSTQYGGIQAIPDDILASQGYIRKIKPDGSVSVVLGVREDEVAKKHIQWDNELEERMRLREGRGEFNVLLATGVIRPTEEEKKNFELGEDDELKRSDVKIFRPDVSSPNPDANKWDFGQVPKDELKYHARRINDAILAIIPDFQPVTDPDVNDLASGPSEAKIAEFKSGQTHFTVTHGTNPTSNEPFMIVEERPIEKALEYELITYRINDSSETDPQVFVDFQNMEYDPGLGRWKAEDYYQGWGVNNYEALCEVEAFLRKLQVKAKLAKANLDS